MFSCKRDLYTLHKVALRGRRRGSTGELKGDYLLYLTIDI